jgi:hypothetical protein
MKKSEQIALVSIVIGAAAGFSLWHWVPFLPGWLDAVAGAAIAGSCFQSSLRIEADKSVVDSKTVNRR